MLVELFRGIPVITEDHVNIPAQPSTLVRFLLALLLVPACSGGENSGSEGTGGSNGTGGITTSGSGGASAGSGGAPGTGGAPEAGTGAMGPTGTGGMEAGTGGAGIGGMGTGGGGMGSGTGGAGGAGGACASPALDALLREGIGDFVRPAPYNYGPYAQKRDVPHGTVKEFTYDESQFYPQSPPRGIKVYEPAQYKQGEESFLAV